MDDIKHLCEWESQEFSYISDDLLLFGDNAIISSATNDNEIDFLRLFETASQNNNQLLADYSRQTTESSTPIPAQKLSVSPVKKIAILGKKEKISHRPSKDQSEAKTLMSKYKRKLSSDYIKSLLYYNEPSTIQISGENLDIVVKPSSSLKTKTINQESINLQSKKHSSISKGSLPQTKSLSHKKSQKYAPYTASKPGQQAKGLFEHKKTTLTTTAGKSSFYEKPTFKKKTGGNSTTSSQVSSSLGSNEQRTATVSLTSQQHIAHQNTSSGNGNRFLISHTPNIYTPRSLLPQNQTITYQMPNSFIRAPPPSYQETILSRQKSLTGANRHKSSKPTKRSWDHNYAKQQEKILY